jgi:hypothetical protein
MTKTEKERVAQLERDLALAKAMRWPGYPSPAPKTRAEIEKSKTEGAPRYGQISMVARGWFANSYSEGKVSYGCSNGVNHGSDGDKTTTQGMGRMYATEVDAWRAVRVEMTELFAAILARVDGKIQGCEP